MSNFSDSLKRARELSGLSRKDIAARLGMTPLSYGKYERGEREPNIDTLRVIAEILHTSVDALVGNRARSLPQFEQYKRYLESIGYYVKQDGGAVALFFPDDPKRLFGIRFSTIEYFCDIAGYALEKAQRGEERRRAETVGDTFKDFEQFVVLSSPAEGTAAPDTDYAPPDEDASTLPPAPPDADDVPPENVQNPAQGLSVRRRG